MGGKGGTISRLLNVVLKVTPSLGKAVEHRIIGGTTEGIYSDKDFEEDLDLIVEPLNIKGYELIEL
ncbi:MAG: hypothetical protein CMI54_00650 [Parcubacteria group bacterium]|nr:hypothetical protein [Parcubacteria group bacterium]